MAGPSRTPSSPNSNPALFSSIPDLNLASIEIPSTARQLPATRSRPRVRFEDDPRLPRLHSKGSMLRALAPIFEATGQDHAPPMQRTGGEGEWMRRDGGAQGCAPTLMGDGNSNMIAMHTYAPPQGYQGCQSYKPPESRKRPRTAIRRVLQRCYTIHDPRSSTLLREPQDDATNSWGWAHPGLINLGALLQVGTFGGIMTKGPEDHPFGLGKEIPHSAADVIVTVLHKHSPQTLQSFFDYPSFIYMHYHTGEKAREGYETFYIERRDQRIRAGFSNPSTGSQFLGRCVTYKDEKFKFWRPVNHVRADRSTAGVSRDYTLPIDATKYQNDQWERGAVIFVMAEAILQRRWTEHSGFIVHTQASKEIPPEFPEESGSLPHDMEQFDAQASEILGTLTGRQMPDPCKGTEPGSERYSPPPDTPIAESSADASSELSDFSDFSDPDDEPMGKRRHPSPVNPARKLVEDASSELFDFNDSDDEPKTKRRYPCPVSPARKLAEDAIRRDSAKLGKQTPDINSGDAATETEDADADVDMGGDAQSDKKDADGDVIMDQGSEEPEVVTAKYSGQDEKTTDEPAATDIPKTALPKAEDVDEPAVSTEITKTEEIATTDVEALTTPEATDTLKITESASLDVEHVDEPVGPLKATETPKTPETAETTPSDVENIDKLLVPPKATKTTKTTETAPPDPGHADGPAIPARAPETTESPPQPKSKKSAARPPNKSPKPRKQTASERYKAKADAESTEAGSSATRRVTRSSPAHPQQHLK